MKIPRPRVRRARRGPIKKYILAIEGGVAVSISKAITANIAQYSSNIVVLPSNYLAASAQRLAEKEGLAGLLNQQHAMLELLNSELDKMKSLLSEVIDSPEASSSKDVKRIREEMIRAASILKTVAGLK